MEITENNHLIIDQTQKRFSKLETQIIFFMQHKIQQLFHILYNATPPQTRFVPTQQKKRYLAISNTQMNP